MELGHLVFAEGADRLPIQEHVSGALARIVRYERGNGRCPAREFLREIQKPMQRRFAGQFDALTKQPDYRNPQRFCALAGNGKPLWEFKEHDHRLYCSRRLAENLLVIVLFNGWVKDKEGKTEREGREIEKAQDLYEVFLEEFQGGIL